ASLPSHLSSRGARAGRRRRAAGTRWATLTVRRQQDYRGRRGERYALLACPHPRLRRGLLFRGRQGLPSEPQVPRYVGSSFVSCCPPRIEKRTTLANTVLSTRSV